MGLPRTKIWPYDREAILSGDPKRLEEALHRIVTELEVMYEELAVPLVGAPGAPGLGLPSGGSVDQVLKKSSSVDYLTEWGSVPADPNLVPLMIEDFDSTRCRIYARSYMDNSSKAYKAFNRDTGSSWMANSSTPEEEWLKVDFSSSYIIVTSYGMMVDTITSFRRPKSWLFQGSNDDAAWTTLDTQDIADTWEVFVEKIYPFVNATAYRYYRLYMQTYYGGNFPRLNFLGLYS